MANGHSRSATIHNPKMAWMACLCQDRVLIESRELAFRSQWHFLMHSIHASIHMTAYWQEESFLCYKHALGYQGKVSKYTSPAPTLSSVRHSVTDLAQLKDTHIFQSDASLSNYRT